VFVCICVYVFVYVACVYVCVCIFLIFIINSILQYHASVILHTWLGHLLRNLILICTVIVTYISFGVHIKF